MADLIVPATAEGPVLACTEGLSFWGGVDPATGRIVDAHHPQAGAELAGRVVLMPTSRGSCTGSGVLLDLALTGRAPAALIFREGEDVLTLGALVAGLLFERALPVVRLGAADWDRVAAAGHVRIADDTLTADGSRLPLLRADPAGLQLSDADRAMLEGAEGESAALAMRIVATMAVAQGARRLIGVTRGHIDGCIYAAPAMLTFAERMADLGARVRIPTTTNAISVDHANWREQGVPEAFGGPAQRLADAYVRMGAAPSFTCAPYLLETPPAPGEVIAWAESNAVIYANSVLGARTIKHADFMDLCIAVTGRAPEAGVYLQAARAPARILEVTLPEPADGAVWPLLGWLAGRAAPDRIPRLEGLAGTAPSPDDLKALCAAFGTTSAAPMLHIAGITPEAGLAPRAGADRVLIGPADFAAARAELALAPGPVDLVALGSPHASAAEARGFAALMVGRRRAEGTRVILTLGRATLAELSGDGTLAALQAAGVTVLPDLCWCSISEPVFPPTARRVLTDSGKYAHYGPALSGREVGLASLAACAEAAVAGRVG
ncbi:cis-3-hydroxy-L-proline dehydratase [Jannaschia ovalis]|uniref:Aconitase X n=1 Tax=Jannaschia ovalis TaxID=3038773 RepID=A0ABY8LB96_9RHOB|nr:aconitase X [Jannaschia sp. GRR-S6-38]WGH77429.1 aconitase X [Jannaschia sp. GRR-S6-38]